MAYYTRKFFYFSAILSLIFLVCPASPAQEGVDLALTSQVSRDQVRGGETFTVNSKVTNLGAKTATKVYVSINHDSSATFVSATASQGECKIYQDVKKTICDVGDIKNGDAVDVLLEMKGVGDDSEPVRSSNFVLAPFGNKETPRAAPPPDSPGGAKEIKIYVNASSIEPDVDWKNNNVDLQLWALPAKNIPPHIEILSPKTQAVIKKPIDKTLDIPVTFKAYDPDGKLTHVVINDNTAAMRSVDEKRFRSVYENGEYKIYIGDKEVSEQELKDYTAELNRKAITKVQPGSDGVYTFLWKNLQYGKNNLHIQAVDNSGGYGFATVTIEVISDAKVESFPAAKINLGRSEIIKIIVR